MQWPFKEPCRSFRSLTSGVPRLRADSMTMSMMTHNNNHNNNNNNNNNNNDARETSLLFQSLSVTIQRFNAVAFQGTISKLSESNERRSPSQGRFNDNVYDDS